MKDILDMINFSILWSFFIANILFLLFGTMSFKHILIVETIIIPIMYVIVYVVCKLVDNDIL